MSLEKMTCGVNYTVNLLRDNVNGLIDASGLSNQVILLALDSLTAGAGGLSYVVPLEKMARGVVGWGGRWVPITSFIKTGSEMSSGFKSGVSYVDDLPQDDYRWLNSLDGYGAYSDSIGSRFTFEAAPLFDWVEAEIFYLEQPGGGTINIDYPTNITPTPSVLTDGEIAIKSVSIKRLVKGSSVDNLSCRINNLSLDGKICVYGIMFKSGDGGPVWVNSSKGGQKTETFIERSATQQVEWYKKLGVTSAIINGGMNDRSSATPAQFEGYLSEACSRVASANSIANIYIVRPNEPSNDGLAQFDGAYLSVAELYGEYLDFRSGTFSQMNSAGLMLDDEHPEKNYQWLMAQKACVALFGRGRWVDTPALVDYTSDPSDPQ